jgi:murein endopeptidase
MRTAPLFLLLLVTTLAPLEALGAPPKAMARRCTGTVSLGTTENGRLVRGRRMPARGDHHALQPFTVGRGFRFATDELVDGLLWVAERVTREGVVPRLVLGNLSQQEGGEMPISRSHESGRDVDVPLLAMDRRGRPLGPLYHRFDARGLSQTSGDRVRFDAARTWKLVRALIECPRFELQTIVLAPSLTRMVLHAARAAGEPEALVARAAKALAKPLPGIKAHDNHMHVRIRCPANDRPCGCKD